MSEPETHQQRFESMGASRVRHLLYIGGLSGTLVNDAVIWLAGKDDAERLRSEASQDEQITTAHSAKTAAWIAAIAAIVAAIVAIIGAVIACLSWAFPRH
jgi:hypothetical protein